jgi:hypothetical protein
MIDDQGGMIPELSAVRGKARVNAHWLPWFRSNSGRPFGREDADFWQANLLYSLAGNFPCVPNFGPANSVDGVDLPPHGWSANLAWRPVRSGVDGESGAAYAVSVMESPEPLMPLSLKKIDAVIPGESVHYESIEVSNRGDRDIEICFGMHNTLGPPFLGPLCRLSGAAERWSTAPRGSEFDETTRLALGEEFASLAAAPLRDGGTADLSVVSPPIGYTDFVSGAIPQGAPLGWSAAVNPALALAYVCFFPGPAGAAGDDVILRFNDIWMQYGGRNFPPWAPCEGGTDLTYCVGTENAAAAYACGLDYSRKAGQVLGAPATVTVPAGGKKTLRYGTLFAWYGDKTLDGGVDRAEAEEGAIVCEGKGEGRKTRFPADPSFSVLKRLER